MCSVEEAEPSQRAPVSGEDPGVTADVVISRVADGADLLASQTITAFEDRAGSEEDRTGSEEDRAPLSQVLNTKSSERPSEIVLEAALERLHGSSSRNLPPLPHCFPERCLDEDGDIDVEALVGGVAQSLEVLKRLASWAQYHQQMWDNEFAFCEERKEQHRRQEAKLQREVKNLWIALRASELVLAVIRAEKVALVGILSEAEARAVSEYKAGPEFREDLEQYGASCYKVGLEVGEDRGQKLATDKYACEAFEAALHECRRCTEDPHLDGVYFMNFKADRMTLRNDEAGPSEQTP
ncbi:hypothetical protein Taro_043247 [Colocasia esculenta]|uniref:Uncharacterized protein n=1 Tax=Colocasia esculenta TaxID=4460 RepID=A0A843WYI6_COLES|nr:hypothetical protein [Colocasia esculenta]